MIGAKTESDGRMALPKPAPTIPRVVRILLKIVRWPLGGRRRQQVGGRLAIVRCAGWQPDYRRIGEVRLAGLYQRLELVAIAVDDSYSDLVGSLAEAHAAVRNQNRRDERVTATDSVCTALRESWLIDEATAFRTIRPSSPQLPTACAPR